MKGTTYSQLQVFQAIVATGSLRGAARQLGIAPPSVSQALKLLESNIGLTLFERSTRKMELTDAGRLLAEQTGAPLAALARAMEQVQQLSAEPRGPVRLTVPRFVYQHYLQSIYGEFCRQYPHILLELSVSDAAVDLLAEGFDLGIRFGDRIEQGMVARKLTEPLPEALFCSAAYARRHGLPDSLAALPAHRLIQYRFITVNQLAPLELDEAGEAVRVQMPSALVVNDTDLMIDAALQGLGIGRLIVPPVEALLADGRLLPVLAPHWRTYPGLYLYYPRHSRQVRRVAVFIDFLLKHFRGQ